MLSENDGLNVIHNGSPAATAAYSGGTGVRLVSHAFDLPFKDCKSRQPTPQTCSHGMTEPLAGHGVSVRLDSCRPLLADCELRYPYILSRSEGGGWDDVVHATIA